jgi:hypothetical protein
LRIYGNHTLDRYKNRRLLLLNLIDGPRADALTEAECDFIEELPEQSFLQLASVWVEGPAG